MTNIEPDYRGVPKSAVIDSLKQAEAFVNGLNLGPATAQEMAAWAAGKPYEAIAAASTRKELAEAMSRTGSEHHFLRLSDIFRHHALADDAGTQARALYGAVKRWGGFSGITTADYRRTNEEQDAHLVKMMAPYTHGAEGRQRFAAFEKDVREALADTADMPAWERQKVESFLDDLRAVRGMIEGQADLADLFYKRDLRGRHQILTVLRAVSGLEQRESVLPQEGPFGRYGIVLDGVGRGVTFDDMMKEAAPFQDRLGKALAPFYETGEVQMTGIGAITRDFNKSGLMFAATRPAAEAVAAAFPDRLVVDHEGRPVAKPKAAPRP